MDDSERQMLRDSIRRVLTDGPAEKSGRALAEFGWFDLLADDPAVAVTVLFEVQGEEQGISVALDAVMATAARRIIDDRGDGDHSQAVLLPGPGAGVRPSSRLSGATLDCDGYGTAFAADASSLLVPARAGEELVLVRVAGGPLDVLAVQGIDPEFGFVRIRGQLQVTDAVDGRDAETAWDAAVAAGRRALAHELVGVSRAMLHLAVIHATERRQFGRAVGSFQAIQHRLADAQVALSAAEAAAEEAWDGPPALSAVLAKLWAGRAARLVAKQAQQTLGGMGFTWEHPFHRYFRRALALDSLLGSAPELTVELGTTLLSTGQAPQLAPL